MIRYKKYQMTGENHPLKGLWYARPLIEDTFDTEKLAKHMSNHNRHSIGICYEGGLDIRGTPADTRTPAQRASLVALLRELKRIFPKILVVGHHDLNPMKECPCFNAVAEYGGLPKLK